MDNFREEFLREAIIALRGIEADPAFAAPQNGVSDELLRKLHTLKGSSATFGLNIASRLAHEIEELLLAAREERIGNTDWLPDVLRDSIAALSSLFEKALSGEGLTFPQEISAKINYLITPEDMDAGAQLPPGFPRDLIKQLSPIESKNIRSELMKDKCITVISVSFEIDGFTENFKALRNSLLKTGEILATFSSSSADRINFQFIYSSDADNESILSSIREYEGKIDFQTFKPNKQDQNEGVEGLEKLVLKAISDGERSARNLGKSVKFEVSATPADLSPEYLEIISTSLLHLIRNAVAHGIEKPMDRIAKNKSAQGLVKIDCFIGDKSLRLAITDNGQGIDTESLERVAKEKNMIGPDFDNTAENIRQLIFRPGLSTASEVSEVSGRGVGLDAVETAVRKANGEIRVHSKAGQGTMFELILPLQQP